MSSTYKDSLFRSLFSNEKDFLSLYNALSGSNYGPDTKVVINTLSDTLFTSRKNDISGLFNDRIVFLTEHQSNFNENMPFRFLSHISRLLENTVTDKTAVYRHPCMNRDAVLQTAIAEAITYCKEHGILADFFGKLLPEEVNMIATEWKLEDAIMVEREEGREEGRLEGKLETARNLKSFGLALDQIARATGLSYNDVARL
jgi:hypothetical protein